jgi:selenocysteine-specific elongation factor
VSHFVLGTAGHIDHGKSALVTALTGRDPDRLKEEKARGITIELGFADLDLGDGRTLSIVDVPGHERFVRHMVAGATGIDAVMLVIAADQGVQPQTREHLEICQLLGIQRGFVVLTKSDLVDRELLDVLTLEVQEFLQGSFLDGAPVIAASSKTGDGLDQVRQRIADLHGRVSDRDAGGIARLPVDRSFVLRGFGTVVTGTLVSGSLAEGQEIEILPGGKRGRIRGLQVHWHRVGEAGAGRRAAVNLQGLHTQDVPRGSTVTVPGTLETTRRIWARVSLLPTAPRSMARGGPIRFHQGTCERAGRMRVLGEAEEGHLNVEILLDQETLLVPGDRFILRRPAPVDTIGGGEVLDIHPPRGKSARKDRRLLESESPEEAILVRLAREGRSGADPAVVAGALGIRVEELDERIGALDDRGAVVRVGTVLFDGAVIARLEEEIESALGAFHEAEPLMRGMPREGLRTGVCPEMPKEVWRVFLDRMAGQKRVALDGERLALPSHRVVLSEGDRALADRVESRLRDAGLEPPDVREILGAGEKDRGARVLELLREDGRLVRIGDGRYFHAEAMDDLLARLREHAQTSRTIDVPTFKRLAGVTRKNAIPLLEFLDAERRTRRVGNLREILEV